MIWTIYNYCNIFSIAKSLHREYIKNERIDEIQVIKLYDIVRNSGCVCIKFFQWILPLLEINFEEIPPWFKILEKIYDNCIIHEKDYTFKIFEEENGYDFNERYELQSVIASGSIGQVYKIKETYTGKLLAMKVLHPNVRRDIWYFEILSNLLLWIPRYRDMLIEHAPVDVSGFINEFNEQTDMIKESKNMNVYLESFSDSLHVYKIPKPISYTRNTLIMTYEESTKFENIECSEYIKSKMIRLMVIFIWNSHRHNICHEDVHKGNWGVRLDENNIKIVIYDYGLCARLLGNNTELYELLEKIFVDNGDTNKEIDNNIIDNLILLTSLCTGGDNQENIKNFIEDKFDSKNMLICDSKLYIKLLFDYAKRYKRLVDTSIMKYILVFSQMQGLVEKYYTIIQYPEQEINQSDSYRISIPDNYSLCKSENICKYYREHCLKKLDEKNETYDNLFLFTSENIKNNIDLLKNIKKQTEKKV